MSKKTTIPSPAAIAQRNHAASCTECDKVKSTYCAEGWRLLQAAVEEQGYPKK